MIKDELEFSWKLSYSVTWGMLWRGMHIGTIPALIIQHYHESPDLGVRSLATLAQIGITFVIVPVSIKWLFGSGRLGNLRLVIMEEEHYQKLASDTSFQGTPAGGHS